MPRLINQTAAGLVPLFPPLARRIELPDEVVTTLKRLKQRLRFERHGLAERHRLTRT